MDTSRKSTKRLSTARELAKVVAEYYLECHQAKAAGKPVGWMPPMNGAIEVFYAMDLQPVFPENWSPVCAAFGLTPGHFSVSERLGYSGDLCGYLRNIVGYVNSDMNGPSVPLGGLPEPDMIISFGGGCIPAMKIFQIMEERFPKARVFHADGPQVAVEDIRGHHVAYAVSEIRRLIGFLEETTGRKLDMARLEEAVDLLGQGLRALGRDHVVPPVCAHPHIRLGDRHHVRHGHPPGDSGRP
jgi:benzoyl-CoA reductase/2-hydroxyglutaryl-CoA dehydratase subunit BcrC/BadD/HgdB